MGFNKKYLSGLEETKELFTRLGEEEFVKMFKGADALIGNSEAINFVDSIIEQHYAKKRNHIIT